MLLQLEVKDDLLEVSIHQKGASLSASDCLAMELFTRWLFLAEAILSLVPGSPTGDNLSDVLVQYLSVSFFVHFLDDLDPHPVFDSSLLNHLERAV